MTKITGKGSIRAVGSVEREDKIDLNRRGKGYRVCGYGPYCPEEEEE
jgi:hypothetical protein